MHILKYCIRNGKWKWLNLKKSPQFSRKKFFCLLTVIFAFVIKQLIHKKGDGTTVLNWLWIFICCSPKGLVEKADSSVFLDILLMRKQKNIMAVLDGKLQPLLPLLFISTTCNIVYTAILRTNNALQPSLFAPNQLLETLLICLFLLARCQKFT